MLVLIKTIFITTLYTVGQPFNDVPIDASGKIKGALISQTPVLIGLLRKRHVAADVLLVLLIGHGTRIINGNSLQTAGCGTGNGLGGPDFVGASRGSRPVDSGIVYACVQVKTKVVRNFVIQLKVEIETLITVVFHQATILIVGAAQGIARFFTAAVDAHIMLLRDHIGAKHIVLPIDGLHVAIQIQILINPEATLKVFNAVFTVEGCQLVITHHVLIRIEYVHALRKILYLHVTVVSHLGFPALGTFGGNHNHPVGSLRTVNSCRRSVLQNINRFDVAGGHIVDAAYRKTIHDV